MMASKKEIARNVTMMMQPTLSQISENIIENLPQGWRFCLFVYDPQDAQHNNGTTVLRVTNCDGPAVESLLNFAKESGDKEPHFMTMPKGGWN